MSLPAKVILAILASMGRKEMAQLDENSKEPLKYNEKLLMRLIRENQDTEYGKLHDFKNIHSIDDYKAKVPFSDYSTYAEGIERLRGGASNVFTAINPVAMAATSGSVSNPKSIPVVQETIDIYRKCGTSLGMSVLLRDLKGKVRPDKFLNLIEVKNVTSKAGMPYGSISGLAVQSAKKLLPYITTSPKEALFPEYEMDKMYLHVRFALEYKNLMGILAAFMTMAVDCLHYISKHWEQIVTDIETGSIHPDFNIPQEVRESLKPRLKPQPKRAAELRREFEKGFDQTIYKRIWPNFSFIYAIGSGGFSSYTEIVKDMTGGIPVYYSFFAASEGMMAVCTKVDKDNYALLPYSMFFEFIPVEDSDKANPNTLTIDQVEVGKHYELVLTNLSGFYRYRISDVVQVVGMYNRCPEIRFAYRQNQMVSMAGEKTNDEHFRWAISELEKEMDSSISEYSVYPDLEALPGHYKVILEAANETELRRLFPQIERVRDVVEEKLAAANPSYGAKLTDGLLAKTEVCFVQTETYAVYRDVMELKGVSRNQIKPVRIIDTPLKERLFLTMIERGE